MMIFLATGTCFACTDCMKKKLNLKAQKSGTNVSKRGTTNFRPKIGTVGKYDSSHMELALEYIYLHTILYLSIKQIS